MRTRAVSRPSDLKTENKDSILRFVMNNGVQSKASVSRQLNMSKPTVSNIVDELVEDHVITPLGKGSSTTHGGKRPMLFSFNPDVGTVGALAIEGRLVKAALFNMSLDLRTTIEAFEHRHDPSSLAMALTEASSWLRSTANRERHRVLGVGVSAPGIVDTDRGLLEMAVHFPLWTNFEARARIEPLFPNHVWIDNEARNLALAERSARGGEQTGTFISLLTDRGLGGCIVMHDTSHRGADYSAGELGHTSIHFEGPVCRCGNRGCWEMYASESALVELVRAAVPHPGTLSLEQIARYDTQGHTPAQAAIAHYARHLAVGIVNLVNSFNPERIIIAGNLHLLGEPFLARLTTLVRHLSLRPATRHLVIEYSRFKSEFGLIGAGALAISQILHHRLILSESAAP